MKISEIILSLLIICGCATKVFLVYNVLKNNYIPRHSQANKYSQYSFHKALNKIFTIKSSELENYGLINNWYHKDLNSSLSNTFKKRLFYTWEL